MCIIWASKKYESTQTEFRDMGAFHIFAQMHHEPSPYNQMKFTFEMPFSPNKKLGKPQILTHPSQYHVQFPILYLHLWPIHQSITVLPNYIQIWCLDLMIFNPDHIANISQYISIYLNISQYINISQSIYLNGLNYPTRLYQCFKHV